MDDDFVVRVIIYVPERDAFIMVYDLGAHESEQEWRPAGGRSEWWDRNHIATAFREAWEEIRLWLFGRLLHLVVEYENDNNRSITLFLCVVEESEARWMRPKDTDHPGLVPRSVIVENTPYQGVRLHPIYRDYIISTFPLLEQVCIAARA